MSFAATGVPFNQRRWRGSPASIATGAPGSGTGYPYAVPRTCSSSASRLFSAAFSTPEGRAPP
jgi:hypothetical protein